MLKTFSLYIICKIMNTGRGLGNRWQWYSLESS